MNKQRLDEFINTMRYKPVLTIGQFLDDFTSGLEEDGKRHEDKPVFIRTLSDVLRGDGSKSLLQRWKDMTSRQDWYAGGSWFFPVVDLYYKGGEIQFVIDSKNFAGKSGRLDGGLGPRDIMARLKKLRDEDGIKPNTRAVVYDKNTDRTLWMYELWSGFHSKFNGLPHRKSMFDLAPNIFDPAAWFDANNAVGIDQSFGIGAETPEWFEALKRRSDVTKAKTGRTGLSDMARNRFSDAGLDECEYTKKQIVEAINYWKKQLRAGNYRKLNESKKIELEIFIAGGTEDERYLTEEFSNWDEVKEFISTEYYRLDPEDSSNPLTFDKIIDSLKETNTASFGADLDGNGDYTDIVIYSNQN